MFYPRVANLQQAGIVLCPGEIAACENKIMMIFVMLTVSNLPPKTGLSQLCVARNALINAKGS
jgi:hypothetical protein